MSKGIGMLFTFVMGVAVGVAATYKISETKYRNLADEEIDSVIERFNNREKLVVDDTKEVVSEEIENQATDDPTPDRFKTTKSSFVDYKSTIAETGYDKVSAKNSKPKNGKKKKPEVLEDMAPEVKRNDNIYTISPDEYNTLEDYRSETYYYSADNFLLNDDCTEVVSDSEMERTIGRDPYGSFGEYEDDAVHVRNDDLKCDYEILLSLKTCEEIMEA